MIILVLNYSTAANYQRHIYNEIYISQNLVNRVKVLEG